MSEDRFKMLEDSNGLYSIFDTEDKEDEPLIYGARFGTETIVDLLNEMNEDIQYLNAFLVEQGLAEEYIRWKGDD